MHTYLIMTINFDANFTLPLLITVQSCVKRISAQTLEVKCKKEKTLWSCGAQPSKKTVWWNCVEEVWGCRNLGSSIQITPFQIWWYRCHTGLSKKSRLMLITSGKLITKTVHGEIKWALTKTNSFTRPFWGSGAARLYLTW